MFRRTPGLPPTGRAFVKGCFPSPPGPALALQGTHMGRGAGLVRCTSAGMGGCALSSAWELLTGNPSPPAFYCGGLCVYQRPVPGGYNSCHHDAHRLQDVTIQSHQEL